MDAYLSKPIRMPEMFETIDALVPDIEPSTESALTGTVREEDPSAGVDEDALLRGVDGSRSLLADVLAVFLGDLPRMLSQIHQAIEAGDGPALAQAAHALKGSIGTFSTKGAFEIARELELMGRADDLSWAADAGSRLERQIVPLRETLEALRVRLSG